MHEQLLSFYSSIPLEVPPKLQYGCFEAEHSKNKNNLLFSPLNEYPCSFDMGVPPDLTDP